MMSWNRRLGRDCDHVRGRTDIGTVGNFALLDKRTDANGGHGNDRPAYDRSKYPGFRSPLEL